MKIKILFFILLSVTLSVNLLSAQKKSKKITVSGFVTDSSNNPIVGAMILIDYKNKVLTQNNGYYKIRIRSDAVVISVRSQNNETRSVLLEGQTTINFTLGETGVSQKIGQSKGKSDESVDLGYRKMDSKKTAVAVSKLDVSGNEYSSYQNIYEMIQGKVAGVDVNGQKIRIRGLNSMTGNNDPMFVVDGMPVSSIDNILPNTVQTITVLKGAAAAIYGSRGVNGVIVITLKKSSSKTK
jgi:TonB-dependent SusC/RagA subfamily outer membrane receptor